MAIPDDVLGVVLAIGQARAGTTERVKRRDAGNMPVGPSETVERLVSIARGAAQDALVAVVQHGSLVTGDFVPGWSDVDLLAITRAALTGQQRQEIVRGAGELADQGGPRFDVNIVSHSVAATPTPTPTTELYIGWHPPRRPTLEIVGPAPERDLVIEFSICRQTGRALVGPEPSRLIGAVPNEWVIAVGDDYLRRWQEVPYDPGMAEFMVFMACRVWMFYAKGRHGSKTEAARWVLSRDPELAVVAAALHRRNQGSDHEVPKVQVMDLIERVRREVAT